MNKIKHYLFPDANSKMFKDEAISSLALAREVGTKLNEVIDMINQLNEIRDNKYQEQDGKIQKAIIYLKDNIKNTMHDLLETMKTNGELADVLGGVLTELNKEIDELYDNRVLQVDSIKTTNFLALDDTDIIKQAFAYKGDKATKIQFTSGKTYRAKGTIDLYSNTEVDLNGATIECSELDYNATTKDSGGLRFINSDNNMITGIENVTFKNGTFKGYTVGILFAFLKGKNIVFENVKFIDCCLGTHIIDLSGCTGVKISNCTFDGCSLESDTNYREMIQLDYANYNAFPYKGNSIHFDFDDTECSEVSIKGCTFSKGNGTTYPNAIGTHSTRENYHHHITIANNKFYDCTNACIRFMRVHDLSIIKNEFINENAATRSDIAFILLDNGRYENVCLPDYNIFILENIVRTEIATSNIMFLYMYSDVTTDVYHRNITISHNVLNSKYENIDNAADCFRFGNVEDVIISSNMINRYKNVILFRNNYHGRNFIVNNNRMTDCRTLEQKFNTSNIKNIYYAGNTWIAADKMSVKQNEVFTELFANAGITTGDAVLSEDVTNFDYLIIATGGVDDYSYVTYPLYPFNMRTGFRPGEDNLSILTAGGKCVIHVKDSKTLNIISTDNKIRRIYGVKHI